MSTTVQGPDSELAGISRMSIALIGPNDSSRTIMAKALAASQSRVVREFADYPAKLSDVSRMMAQNFDVVMIDLDSDESYALLIVENIAALGNTTVMVYSVRNDPTLVMSAMRAGARDFLPVPADSTVAEAAPPPAPVAPPAAVQVAPPAAEPVQTRPVVTRELPPRPPAPPRVASESQEADEKRIYNNSTYVKGRETQPPEAVDVLKSDSFSSKANQSEATQERASQPAIASKAVEASPRSSFASELSAKTISGSVVANALPATTPVAGGGIETDAELLALFRNIKVVDDREEPSRTRKNWLLIGAGVAAVVVLLLLFFLNPFKQPAASSVAAPAPADTQQPVSSTDDLPIVKTDKSAKQIAKPSPNTPAAKTGNSQAPAPDLSNTAQVAQFTTPGRISSDVKKVVPVEEAPAAFTPGAMDGGGGLPGTVLGGGNKPKVVGTMPRISAGVAEGMLLHRSSPIYPPIAKNTRVSGTVVLKANITKSGTIDGLHVISGPKMLSGAAMDSVKTWRYRPYMLDGQPVEIETTISVIFSLGQ